MALLSYAGTMVTGAVVNAWRHRTMSVITVLIVSLMMTTLGMFLIVENELSHMVNSMGRQVNLIIYLEDEAPPQEVLDLREELLNDARVISVDYITKEEALERLREFFREEQDLLQPLLDNPLPASLEVRSDDPDYLLTQVDYLAAKRIVEEVVLPEDLVENLLQIIQVVRFLGFALGSGLGLVTLFVIGSTIRLTVYARRGEIEVLRLMGASDHFIRLPFLLEGVLFGLSGALVSFVIVGTVYIWVHELIQQTISFSPVSLDTSYLFRLLLIMSLAGITIGGLGSFLSVRRFLTI
jgi:cell division transport system permease protein